MVILICMVFCWFSAIKCEINEENYNIINSMIKSPIRREKEFSNSSQVGLAINEESSRKGKTLSEEELGKEKRESALKDGIKMIKKMYNECNRKINRRINKLLSTKMSSKSETEKDLFELKEYLISLYRCLKVSTFKRFDGLAEEEVIPLTDYVDLVRDPRKSEGNESVVRIPAEFNGKLSVKGYASHILKNDWNFLILEKFYRLLESHSLKFRFNDSSSIEGRGRRRDQRMFAMMVMGFMIMATILIPMGFQFLTVLGGKSLLMAKMALIMSAINGLKKIATSQVGYGFYHTGPDNYHHDHHHHGFHDKLLQVKQEDPQTLFFAKSVN